jgi:hypothetical protein
MLTIGFNARTAEKCSRGGIRPTKMVQGAEGRKVGTGAALWWATQKIPEVS